MAQVDPHQQVNVALQFRPPWQTCLTRFDQLYVLLFLKMKLLCDRVLGDYFTWGRVGVCQVMSSMI